MGGFFITNASDSCETARKHFEAQPLGARSERVVGDLQVLSWAKRSPLIPEAAHQAQDGFIIGCGTFFFRGAFGAQCLPRLWEALSSDWSALREVDGHFAFVVRRGTKLHVVTDKSTTYHVYVARHGRQFWISTSLLAIANCLPRLTLGKQEALEFVNTETTFGGATLFEEIQQAQVGGVIACDSELRGERYYEHAPEPVGFDEFVERYLAYFRKLAAAGVVPSCDLSGGFDSRTVAALCARAGLAVHYDTHEHASDVHDHEVAQRVARHLGGPIEVHRRLDQRGDVSDLVQRAYRSLGLARDIYGAVNTTAFVQDRSAKHTLVLGGACGEVLRDKYVYPDSLDALIRKYYVSAYIWMNPRPYREYRERLAAKFQVRMRQWGEHDVRNVGARLYCLEKMSYWGGSRVSALNQYCHWLHPLFDFTLAKHALGFSEREKANGQLQRRIIGLVPGLAEIPFSSELPAPGFRGVVQQFVRSHVPMPNQLPPDARRLIWRVRKTGYRPPPKLGGHVEELSRALAAHLSLSLSDLQDNALRGRLATLAYGLDRLSPKVGGF